MLDLRRHRVDELLEPHVGRDDDRVAHHQVADRPVAEDDVAVGRPPLVARRREQEPADEREPRPAERAHEHDEHEPAGDHRHAEELTGPGRDPGRPGEVLARMPQDRTQDPSAVERQRRQEVEGEQHQVDVAEPGGDAVDRVRKPSPGDPDRGETEHERDRGAGDRDPELRPGRRELAAETGDTSEQPERDALDLHPLPLRHERVAELVGEDRREEERRGGGGHADVRAVGEPGILRREDPAGERPHDHREDDEQAPVDPDTDPADGPEVEARRHALSVAGAERRIVANRARPDIATIVETGRPVSAPRAGRDPRSRAARPARAGEPSAPAATIRA